MSEQNREKEERREEQEKTIKIAKDIEWVIENGNYNKRVDIEVNDIPAIGLVNGLGSLDQPLNLKYIRKSIANDLSYGDIVVTSGENDNYMKDIPIGSISKIAVLDYESSLTIELNPILDFSRLENVIVVNQKELNDRKDN